ncbi:hypothetical protein NDU88_001382 [Pleurodeles waltl]|uniref:Uncharacterized protein n=1 Tax=Pleurodeles waltl TaxID=8319 RepID=A0AAV7NAK6_PLEWA|nr:hypothetical protein NDU88_001382 [Pleurodeles waltl]
MERRRAQLPAHLPVLAQRALSKLHASDDAVLWGTACSRQTGYRAPRKYLKLLAVIMGNILFGIKTDAVHGSRTRIVMLREVKVCCSSDVFFRVRSSWFIFLLTCNAHYILRYANVA